MKLSFTKVLYFRSKKLYYNKKEAIMVNEFIKCLDVSAWMKVPAQNSKPTNQHISDVNLLQHVVGRARDAANHSSSGPTPYLVAEYK